MTQAELNIYVQTLQSQIDTTLPIVPTRGTFLMYLLSPENMAAASSIYGVPQSRTVKLLGQKQPQKVLDFQYRKPYQIGSSATNTADTCLSGEHDSYQTHSVPLNKRSKTRVKAYTNQEATNQGLTLDQLRTQNILSLIAELDAIVAREVATEVITAKRSNTVSAYIGKNAPRGGSARAAWVDLPMFKLDGTVNIAGESVLRGDMVGLGVGMDEVRYFGGAYLQQYATLKGLSCCANGYDPRQLDTFAANMAYVDTGIESAMSAIQKPKGFIVYRNGSMMFVHSPRFSNAETAANAAKYVIKSPNTGLFYDVDEVTVTCGADGQIEYRVGLSIDWALAGYGEAVDMAGLGVRAGVTDVFAYNIAQSDNKVFDYAPVDVDAALVAQTVSFTPENIAVAHDFGVKIVAAKNGTIYTLIASVSESNGYRVQSATSFVWVVDGTTSTTNTNVLTIDTATTPLASGDVIAVTATYTNGTTTTTRTDSYTVA